MSLSLYNLNHYSPCSLYNFPILSHALTHKYTLTHSHIHSISYPIELTAPTVEGDMVTSMAGRPFSTDCNFTVPDHLVRYTTLQWFNSTPSVVANTGKLMFPNLQTSHGGDYLCVVNISILLLKISLTGNGTTRLNVQSMLNLPTIAICLKINSLFSLCTILFHYLLQYLLHWL